MSYPASPNGAGAIRVRPDPAQFWAGAAATAVVAALIALVGILVSRWALSIPILAPTGDGAWGNAHTGEYVLLAARAALIAAGLLYLLELGAPAPRVFFGWIVGLATLAAPVAGENGMSLPRFLFFDAIGASLWLLALLTSGRLFGAPCTRPSYAACDELACTWAISGASAIWAART